MENLKLEETKYSQHLYGGDDDDDDNGGEGSKATPSHQLRKRFFQ